MLPQIKMYGITTVSAKGQVVIPADARESLEMNEGDKLVVLSTPDGKGVVLFKAEVFESIFEQMSKQFADITKSSKFEGVK